MTTTTPVRVASAVGAIGLLTTVLVGVSVAVEPDRERDTDGARLHVRGRAPEWGQAHEFLRRAAGAVTSLPHEADLVVVSFGERGPRIARLEVAFTGGEGLFVHEAGLEPGRADPPGFLRSSSRLLHVGGPTEPSGRLDRLLEKYQARPGEVVELDTGPAEPLALHERTAGVLREVLYADVATGLLVRRETYGRDGSPVRTAAYTRVSAAAAGAVPTGLDADGEAPPAGARADADALVAAGFAVPRALPLGYELLSCEEVADANVPTAHLVYGDGMYTVSVFQQLGRMRASAVAGARELRLPSGGAVWGWPGSEPGKIVWSGADATFTALGDAPPDELLEVVAGLPADPPASILNRLGRGFSRLWRWFPSNDRSET